MKHIKPVSCQPALASSGLDFFLLGLVERLQGKAETFAFVFGQSLLVGLNIVDSIIVYIFGRTGGAF